MGYLATCPVCANEWEFDSKKEMDKTWRYWQKRLAELAKRLTKRS